MTLQRSPKNTRFVLPAFTGWQAAQRRGTGTTLVLRGVAALVSWALVVLVLGGPARAQDPFGVGGPAAPPAAAPADPGAGPAAAPADDQESDPRILAVRQGDLGSPLQLAYAARTVLQFGRPDEAKRYLQQLLAEQPSPETLVQLQQTLGTDLFLRFRREADLQPEGATLADAVLQAVRARREDPARIQAVAEEALAATGIEQRRRLAELKESDELAMQVLVGMLVEAGDAQRQTAVGRVLLAWGRGAVDPLVALLESGDQVPAEARVAAYRVLGALRDETAVPYLLVGALDPNQAEPVKAAAEAALQAIVGRVPGKAEAEGYLRQRVTDFLTGAKLAGQADTQGTVALWVWDPQQRAVRQVLRPTADAGFLVASRAAGDLARLNPENRDDQRQYLITRLETEKRLSGFEVPISFAAGSIGEAAVAAGAAVLEDVLEQALRQDLFGAATAACEALGETGDPEVLRAGPTGLPALMTGLRTPDRHVRFAALAALLKLDPQRPFAGSSLVPEMLGYFARSTGQARVLIGMPRIDRAQDLVGLLSQLGFAGDTAQTGGSLLDKLATYSDYDVVLLSDQIQDPPLNETLQLLRRNGNGRELPVALIAAPEPPLRDVREGRSWFMDTRQGNPLSSLTPLEVARRRAALDPLTIAVAMPYDRATLANDLRRLLEMAGRERVMPDIRLQQASLALQQLARLAENPQTYGFYDLYRQEPVGIDALSVPALSAQAAEFLGRLGTPTAQEALLDFASQPGRTLADRQAAVAALDRAIQERGLRLTRATILQAYDRYNASERLDAGTQKVLSDILDAIERPLAAVSNESVSNQTMSKR